MNESSEEGINLNRGYDIGFVDALKEHLSWSVNFAEFYENGLKVSDNLSEEEKRLHENSNRGRQMLVVMLNKLFARILFGEEDLPW